LGVQWLGLTTAQYTAAAKTNVLDPTAKSLDSLAAIFKKDPKLAEVLHAPTLSVSDKQQIVQELQKQLGPQDKEGIVKNFLQTLAENNRLGVLPGVVSKFGELMGAHRGEIELTVTSATVRPFHSNRPECEAMDSNIPT
jgi:F-type H+-transporting ATPase subunit O